MSVAAAIGSRNDLEPDAGTSKGKHVRNVSTEDLTRLTELLAKITESS